MGFRKLTKIRDPEIVAKNVRALNYRLRERWWALTPHQTQRPIFLIGCSRSGTTVTFETLSTARELTSFGYELPQLWDGYYGPLNNGWHSEAADARHAEPEFAKQFLSYCYARLGNGRILDKTCINVMRASFLHALFPDASFVFIHRDGRENVSSLIDGWRDGRFNLTQFLGKSPEPVAIDDRFDCWHFFLPPGWRDYSQATLAAACAYQWVTANSLALKAKEASQIENWIEIRYEDVLARPVDLFRQVFSRLELEFTPQLEARCQSLNSRPTSQVSGPPDPEKWKKRNPREIESILPMIEVLSRKLGRGLQ